MNIRDVMLDPPPLHYIDGKPAACGLSDEVLVFIDDHVGGNSRTLETGCGVSTILFALKGADHTCVAPAEEEIKRIKEYCGRQRISLRKVNFLIQKSEDVLPRLEADALDLVLIDGRHGFPAPFIDWYYTAGRLSIGGVLIVDDTQLWTGQVLKQFLLSEKEWKLVKDFHPRSAAFVKLQEGSHQKEWEHQPYLVLQSNLDGAPPRFPRTRYALDMIRKGDVSTLAKKTVQKITGHTGGNR